MAEIRNVRQNVVSQNCRARGPCKTLLSNLPRSSDSDWLIKFQNCSCILTDEALAVTENKSEYFRRMKITVCFCGCLWSWLLYDSALASALVRGRNSRR